MIKENLENSIKKEIKEKHRANWEYRDIILKEKTTDETHYAKTLKEVQTLTNTKRFEILYAIKNNASINNYEVIDYKKISTKGLPNPNRKFNNPYICIVVENTKTKTKKTYTSTKEIAEELNVSLPLIYKLLHQQTNKVKDYKLIEAYRLINNK